MIATDTRRVPPPARLRRLLLGAALGAAFAADAAPADLTALDLEQLLRLTVTGASKYEQKQSEVPASVTVITRREIKTFGWRTLEEALGSLPGIHTTYDRQYAYLGARGFGLPGDYSTRVLVNIDGNRFNEPTYDAGPFGQALPLDIDLIERIEFIPGPGGAVYGQNAMFGVVNIVTRRGADLDGAELAAAYQHPQALREGRATWGRRFASGLDVMVSVSGMQSRGEDRRFDFGALGTSGVAAGLDGGRDRELYARVAQGAWSLQHVYGNNRKDDPTGAYLSDPLVAGSYQADRYALTQLRFDESDASGNLQFSVRLFAGDSRYRGMLTYGTPLLSYANTRWHGGELRLVSTAWSGHKLMLGLEAQANTRLDQGVRDIADPSNDLLIARNGHRIGVYAQDEWRLAPSWTATAGLRIDHNDTTGTKPSPRAALIWQADPATTVKALYGRAHRAPNVFERDYGDGVTQVPNPALKGESIDTLEGIVDRRIGRDVTLRASVYRWTMDALVTLGIDPVSGLSQYQSGGTVSARGVELSADKTWTSGARLRGSVSLQDVKQSSGSALPNSPEVLARLNLSGPLPWAGLRAGYEWRYDALRRTLNGDALGGYAVSNLVLGTQALASGLEVSLAISNLFDKRYAHPGAETNWQDALVQDGRAVRLQATLKF